MAPTVLHRLNAPWAVKQLQEFAAGARSTLAVSHVVNGLNVSHSWELCENKLSETEFDPNGKGPAKIVLNLPILYSKGAPFTQTIELPEQADAPSRPHVYCMVDIQDYGVTLVYMDREGLFHVLTIYEV